jgi:hypothetical protein
MLRLFSELLRQVLLNGVPGFAPVEEDRIGFQPPDDDWRTRVGALQRNAFNVYLADLRENRELRSNARHRTFRNGIVDEDPAPVRLDCHYLITAWSPAIVSPQVEPNLDEHRLLYQAAAVLFRAAPLNPSRAYLLGSPELNAWPERFRDADFPASIAPVEGYAKLSEFWSAMDPDARQKPALYLVATLPVELTTVEAGPMVTTRITEYRQAGKPETAEVWIEIGGHVLDTAHPDPVTGDPTPVPGAWVRLETTTGAPLQTTETDERGRFRFGGLRAGPYQLNWRAAGQPTPAAPRAIDVPSPTGEYDLEF